MIETEDRVTLLEEAQELIEQAIDKISVALEDTGGLEAEAQSYIISHLSNWANGHNPYDSTAIPRLIEAVMNPEEY